MDAAHREPAVHDETGNTGKAGTADLGFRDAHGVPVPVRRQAFTNGILIESGVPAQFRQNLHPPNVLALFEKSAEQPIGDLSPSTPIRGHQNQSVGIHRVRHRAYPVEIETNAVLFSQAGDLVQSGAPRLTGAEN